MEIADRYVDLEASLRIFSLDRSGAVATNIPPDHQIPKTFEK
jgi:hypothetical protein